jgi:hypothetical protein
MLHTKNPRKHMCRHLDLFLWWIFDKNTKRNKKIVEDQAENIPTKFGSFGSD